MDNILLLKIFCAILQFTGFILFAFVKMFDPAWVPVIWGLIAISGFASIVQAFIDRQNTSAREGFIGLAFALIALQALFVH